VVDPWWLGALSGASAMVLKAGLMLPLTRPAASPWARWGGSMARRDPAHRGARGLGVALLAAYGAAWGLLFAAYDQVRAPLYASYVLQGVFLGGVVFLINGLLIMAWPPLRRSVDRRLWVGLLLTDVLFGATVGLCFLLLGPLSPV
jgi:hypothetical protein